MLHLALFASGRGSNFKAIHQSILDGRLEADIRLLVGGKPDAEAVLYARKHEIPVFIEEKPAASNLGIEVILLEALEAAGADFVALCGYIRLVPASIVRRFAGRITNIHPALLPAFGGKGMYGKHVHEAVIESGAKYSGASVHLVSEEYDTGPIVLQRAVEVSDDDTPESLAAKILPVEHALYSEALQLFAEGRVQIDGRRTRILSPAQSKNL